MKSKDKKKKEAVINKEETAEDWCFVCKDGGDILRICDYKDCLKSYHPHCVGKDNSFLESEDHWACDWHSCSICGKRSYLHCYTCKYSVCRRCLPVAELIRVKGQYGFCTDCLKLALLIEEGKDHDSNGNPVDFRDRDTTEGLFMEYYMIIKKEEGFESGDLYAAKDGVEKKKEPDYSSEEYGEEDKEDQSDFDGEDLVKKCRRRCNEKRSGRKESGMRTPMESRKNDFIGWGSRSLIDFLTSIGKSTDEKLHQHDVTSIVNAYVKEKQLLHPEKRKMILCDERLQSLFRKKIISKNRVHELLEAHFVENYDDSDEDEAQCNSEDDNACIPDARKRQKKLNVERKLSERESADNVPVGCFASIVVENVKLVYLRRTVLLELLKQPESFVDKVVGCFIRIKSDPYDYHSRNSHQLMQVRGIGRVSIGQNNPEAILLISAMPEEISTSQLSDGVFSKEECEDLRRRVLAGQLKRPTVEDLQQKANALHVDLTKHWIVKELALLQNLIDQANEKGWRRELAEYLEKKRKLQTPSEVSKLLENVPKVIPDLDEYHPNPEDTVNGMSSEKDSPESILRCNSSITDDECQDDKESADVREQNDEEMELVEQAGPRPLQVYRRRGGLKPMVEKTRDCRASPLVRKQLIFKEPNSEAEDGNITCRKPSQPTAELKIKKSKGEELEMCSQETNSNESKVTATVHEDQNTDDSESSIWCLEAPNGEPKKFTLSVLKRWSQKNPYASKFKVWKEGENESNAVWLREVLSKK